MLIPVGSVIINLITRPYMDFQSKVTSSTALTRRLIPFTAERNLVEKNNLLRK